jgi:flavorubredoxin
MNNQASPKTLVLYWSATGNTEKVAKAIWQRLVDEGVPAELTNLREATVDDLCQYDLVFMGCPSYMFAPPDPVMAYIKGRMQFHVKRGDVKLGAPKVPGKRAVVFCTYSGPHTGIDEAIPVGKHLAQFFAHLGFSVLGEWYVVGEFHGREDHSTKGRLGDIRGRPSDEDLNRVMADVSQVLAAIRRG